MSYEIDLAARVIPVHASSAVQAGRFGQFQTSAGRREVVQVTQAGAVAHCVILKTGAAGDLVQCALPGQIVNVEAGAAIGEAFASAGTDASGRVVDHASGFVLGQPHATAAAAGEFVPFAFGTPYSGGGIGVRQLDITVGAEVNTGPTDERLITLQLRDAAGNVSEQAEVYIELFENGGTAVDTSKTRLGPDTSNAGTDVMTGTTAMIVQTSAAGVASFKLFDWLGPSATTTEDVTFILRTTVLTPPGSAWAGVVQRTTTTLHYEP